MLGHQTIERSIGFLMLGTGFKKSPAFAGLYRYCELPYSKISPSLLVKLNVKYW
jgi:hypothetical protein